MEFQYVVSPPATPPAPADSPPSGAEITELLRQILDVQREQLAQLRASAATLDAGARWRAFLARWQQDFPDLPRACRDILPLLEQSYGTMISELAEFLNDRGADGLDPEFTLGDFLDRYGLRLSQLGTVLNVVAHIAEAANTLGESSS
ncbi:MAG: hypothetical protein ACK4RK_15570 [Gemmataceae bacterium]